MIDKKALYFSLFIQIVCKGTKKILTLHRFLKITCKYFFNMNRLILFIVLILSTLYSFSAPTTNNPAKRIKEINTHTSAIIASFSENQITTKTKKDIQRKGVLYYLYPNQLSMIYDEPAGDQTIIFENMLYIRKEGKTQKLKLQQKESHMSQLRNLLIWSFVGDIESIAKAYNAKIVPSESPICLSFKLEVKKEKQGQEIQSFYLIYDKISGAILQLRINKANGNYVLYKLENPVINDPIDDKVWTMEGLGDIRLCTQKSK